MKVEMQADDKFKSEGSNADTDALYELSRKEEEEYEKKQAQLEELKKMKAAEAAKQLEPEVANVFMMGSVKKEESQKDKEKKERQKKAMSVFKMRLAKNDKHAAQHKKAKEKPKPAPAQPRVAEESNPFGMPSVVRLDQSGNISVPPPEDEIDPLDAFMAAEIDGEAEKKLQESKARALKLAEDVAAGIDVGDKPEKSEFNQQAKHCYVCKKWGHTKNECPHKRCSYCFEEGHVQKECPKWTAEIVRFLFIPDAIEVVGPCGSAYSVS
jgi:hypothetical protein